MHLQVVLKRRKEFTRKEFLPKVGFQGLRAKALRLMEVIASACQVPMGSSGGDRRQWGLWQMGNGR